MRRRSSATAAGLVLGLLAAAAPAAEEPARSGASSCRVGQAPTREYGQRPPEAGARYATRPIVIGCATTPSGRRLEFVGYQLAVDGQRALCIDRHDLRGGTSSGCGSNGVLGGGAIDAVSVERSDPHPPLVEGALAPSVEAVVVRYELDRRLRERAAAVVSVRDPALLRALAVREPFGLYVAEVAAGARGVSAEARDAAGRSQGLAFFAHFGAPRGAARACFGQPRIERLTLLDRARASRTARVRAVVSYPRGRVVAVRVAFRGGGGVADLTRLDRTRERRTVTLPVRFTQPGTVAVDVTAEGAPTSRRCGRLGGLRDSPTRTLGVRVG